MFDSSDDDWSVVTGVLINIPSSAYGKNVVSKLYTKIKIDGTEFTVYGEPIVTSIYEVALISKGITMTPEQKQVVDIIIEKAHDMSPDLGFDLGGLYN